MNSKELKELTKNAQAIIKAHLKETGKTESGLAKEAKIHPAQMLLFMSSKRGLTAASLEKIGAVIFKHEKAKK